MQEISASSQPPPTAPWGIVFALSTLALWAGLLAVGLSGVLPWPATLLLVPLQAFCCTGLFIHAHDAMHGTLVPGRPWANRAAGALLVAVYAAFSYRSLRTAHHAHHAAPASAMDPDFHDGDPRFFAWYVAFLRRYVTPWQVLRMALLYQVLTLALGVSPARALAHWALPAVASTVQLFAFGTWRPHREPSGGHTNAHRARSETWPPWLLFVTCWNFGLHHEHHAAPWVPWWRLPRVACADGRSPRESGGPPR